MIETRVIRYRTTSESADENARLIEVVFAELAERNVPGIRYEVFRLDDGVTFVHVATLDGEMNPLESSPAFAAFQSGLGARLEEGPYPAVATVVGSHGVG
ncbi:MAG: hypothetical protein WCK41_03400 [Actinomycetes bacterium]